MKRNHQGVPTLGFTVGASGAGKGFCVGSVLKEFHGVHTFVTGDWCRTFREQDANNGVLVNDLLINSAVQSHFAAHPDHFYMIDAPRSRDQVYFFMEMFQRRFKQCRLVTIHVATTYEQSIRLIQHRAIRQRRFDDARREAVAKRLEAYFTAGGILETVIPILQEHTNYHCVEHQGFNDPVNVSDDRIDTILEHTRQPVRTQIGPQFFGHPNPNELQSAAA